MLLCVVAWACTSSESDAPRRFVVRSDAVVRDVGTGLEWTRHDDGAGLEWHAADAYCRQLGADGGGWRLPGVEELFALYDKAMNTPCGTVTCHVDSAFTLTSPYVWTETAMGEGARTYVDMQYGTRLSPTITPRLLRRVLCVRSPSGR